jgi:branched-chain amino acid aminotransferase
MIWINGEPHPATGPHVSARDRGFTLADGLFETMRASGGTVFRLDRHLARLSHGLAVLGIPEPPQLRDWVIEPVGAAGTGDWSVRLTVTRGVGPGGLAPPAEVRPTVVIALAERPAVPARYQEQGLTVVVASGRKNERAMTAGIKTLAYTDGVAAWLEAQRAGADDALFLDCDGHCSEATASNLFVWTGRTLMTPPSACGALPGITREAVLDSAETLGVPATERLCDLAELLGAEEAFLTSSLRGIVPLVRVNGRAIGGGVPGELTRQLVGAYTALVAQEHRR